MRLQVKIDTTRVINNISNTLRENATRDKVLRAVATGVMNSMKVRIHQDGLDANGNRIGTYSPAYMRVRTGLYKRNATFKKGKNKGKTKPGGVFTRGENKGQPRPKYNRTADTKVILSLTRQMENDMAVINTAKGYGIGYKNPENKKKARWCEATYNKRPIFSLSDKEKQLAVQIAEDFIAVAFRQNFK